MDIVNDMKKTINFLCILCLAFLMSCHSHKQLIEVAGDGTPFGMSMFNEYERDFTKVQFDSICKADKITNNLNRWHSLYVYDGEDGSQIKEFLYIKYQGSAEYIYRLVQKNEGEYKITKRIKK